MLRTLPVLARRLVGALALSLCAATAHAQSIIVPDDYPTIGGAFASGAEEVMIRPGTYPESVVIDRPFVLRGLPEAGSELPVIDRLVLDDARQWSAHSAEVAIENVRVRGAVMATIHLGMNSGPLTLAFRGCVLDSGVTDDASTASSQHDWAFYRCTIGGPVRLRRPDRAVFTENVFAAGVSVAAHEMAQFHRNRIEGTGAVAIEVMPGCEDVRVVSNIVRGFDVGIRVSRTSTTITDNIIENCPVAGIQVTVSYGASIARNLLRECGGGIVVNDYETVGLDGNRIEDGDGGIAVSGGYNLVLTGNLVLGCGTGISASGEEVRSSDNRVASCGSGISLLSASTQATATRDTVTGSGSGLLLQAQDANAFAIECRVIGCAGVGIGLRGDRLTAVRNVVGRAGGAALMLQAEESAQALGNTSYVNGGSGFVLTGEFAEGSVVHRNLGFGNAGHGLDVPAGITLSLDGNDWFENQLGAVQGVAPSPNDFAVDPLFCDLAANDVSLREDSPLAAAPGFEQIGALGVGCDDTITPTLVTRFQAERVAGGVAVRFSLSGDLAGVTVERAESVAGPWHVLAAEPTFEGDVLVAVDREAVDGARWYRLVAGREVLAGPIAVDAVAGASRLIDLAPNPSTGPVRITFSLARTATIALELFDAQGRNVATLARGLWPGGRHVVEARGMEALAPGLYVIRYAYPGGAESRKLLRAR